MKRVMTCLWKGEDLPSYSNGEYGHEDVIRLAHGLARHMPDAVLTVLMDTHFLETANSELYGDLPIPVDFVPFSGHDCGGWSRILEAFCPTFHQDHDDRCLLVGLDTVLVGDCDWLFEWNESVVGLPLDPYTHPLPCNAVVSFDFFGAATVWNRYIGEAARNGMADFYLGNAPSEMLLLRSLYAENDWKPLEPEVKRLLSYKVHVAPYAKQGGFMWSHLNSIVYLHGRPKLSDLPDHDPVKREWLKCSTKQL
jgi:hypothetical protein